MLLTITDSRMNMEGVKVVVKDVACEESAPQPPRETKADAKRFSDSWDPLWVVR